MEKKINHKSQAVKKPRRRKRLEKHWTEFETPTQKLSTVKQRNIARQLYNHVREDGVYDIISICGELDIAESTWYEWRNKYPVIKEASDRAKAYLAGKRFNHAASKKACEKMLNWAGQYSKSHKEFQEYLHKMKDKDVQKFAQNVIEVLSIPHTDVKPAPAKPDVSEEALAKTEEAVRACPTKSHVDGRRRGSESNVTEKDEGRVEDNSESV